MKGKKRKWMENGIKGVDEVLPGGGKTYFEKKKYFSRVFVDKCLWKINRERKMVHLPSPVHIHV